MDWLQIADQVDRQLAGANGLPHRLMTSRQLRDYWINAIRWRHFQIFRRYWDPHQLSNADRQAVWERLCRAVDARYHFNPALQAAEHVWRVGGIDPFANHAEVWRHAMGER